MLLYLTHADTVALDSGLRRAFPKMRLFSRGQSYTSEMIYFDDIASSGSWNIFVIIDDLDWEPVFKEIPSHRLMDYRITNYPERLLYLHRLHPDRAVSRPEKTELTIGWPPAPLTPNQRALADKVRRILRKVGTFRLCKLAFDCSWVPLKDDNVFAGHGAVRWVLEHEERRLGDCRPIESKSAARRGQAPKN